MSVTTYATATPAMTTTQQQRMSIMRRILANGFHSPIVTPKPSQNDGRCGFSRWGWAFGASWPRPAGLARASESVRSSIERRTSAWTPVKLACFVATHCFSIETDCPFFRIARSYRCFTLSSASPIASSAPITSSSHTCSSSRGTFSGSATGHTIRQLNSASPVLYGWTSVL